MLITNKRKQNNENINRKEWTNQQKGWLSSLILGGGVSSPLPPFHRSSSPEKKEHGESFYDTLPPADRPGATEIFGQSHFLFGKHSILVPRPHKILRNHRFKPKKTTYANLRPAFWPLKNLLPHRTHYLSPNPNFFCTFLASQPRSSHPGRKPCMHLNQTKSRFSPPYRFTGTTLSKLAPTEPIFWKNTLHSSPGKYCLKPLFL